MIYGNVEWAMYVCNKSLCDVKEAYSDVEIGKQINKPGVVSTTELLQLIHTDIMGPFPVKAYAGCRFLATFVDDYSSNSFAYLILRKSDVLEKFKNFKKLVAK